jgi:PhzF family phenazine biosynthesis protein
MGQRIIQVDAFTAQPFAGNPAAVCVLAAPAPEAWMRHVAREMNLSETAFLLRQGEAFSLRWFTPTQEEELCGHATLASAHVLWEEGILGPTEAARFDTRSGRLTCRRAGAWIEMDFPAEVVQPCPAPEGLAESLGVTPLWVGRNRLDILVEVATETEVRAAQPDFARLARIPTRGVILTARATSGARDFVSRFFAPHDGVNEDPVTGSAHCGLGPFWGERLGKRELVGNQVSERGGVVRVALGEGRVLLSGQAVTVLRGELV